VNSSNEVLATLSGLCRPVASRHHTSDRSNDGLGTFATATKVDKPVATVRAAIDLASEGVTVRLDPLSALISPLQHVIATVEFA
jgi:hypothetical protein